MGNATCRVHDRVPVRVRVDKQLDDLLRLRSWACPATRSRRDRACRAAWRERIDDLARSQLTDEQYERYLAMIESTDTLRPERFLKTLDALYASPRADKLDYLSLNVYEPVRWSSP